MFALLLDVRPSPLARRVLGMAALASLVALLAPQALAAGGTGKSVYRCEEPGRVIYADEPCGQSSKSVNVDDSRTPQQRREAIEAAQREADFAKRARGEREKTERQASTQGAAGIQSLPKAGPDPKANKDKPARVRVAKKKTKATTLTVEGANGATRGTITRSPATRSAPLDPTIPTVKLSPPKS